VNSYAYITENLNEVRLALPEHVTLVAVSKTHPPEAIQTAYDAGQRIFGENKVQELVAKYEVLPRDIEWHLIGHLQTNKVKYIADFVSFIHAVDSEKLLDEINKRAAKAERVIDVLLQVHIAEEDSKFGFDDAELTAFVSGTGIALHTHVRIRGLMGMATFTDDREQVRREFKHLKRLFDQLKTSVFVTANHFDTLSMGMSGDFDLAIEEGSTMVRIGSTLFGARNYGTNG
jgi:pyridoxal phosphate enzyme (YggS family)